MKDIVRLIWLAVIAASFPGSPGWAQDIATQGLMSARQLCAECHAVERAQARSPNPDAPPFETIANTPGMTGMALSATLQSPHQTMPNVMLDANQLSSIAAYVLSLRRAD